MIEWQVLPITPLTAEPGINSVITLDYLVQEQEKMSGLVWILLFSILIGLSTITNSLYIIGVAVNPRRDTLIFFSFAIKFY
jgi:hypothetical protein